MEVHPPHHSVTNWRDVFTHLAIVTVGLLIALGLEAAAEAFHHHRRVIETREALRKEREGNHQLVKDASVFFRREAAALQNISSSFATSSSIRGRPQRNCPAS